ncbi:Fibroin-3 related protein [Rutstroemia sp. NJR-2017a WRK4]|nr:Fibroin-3 related protein [Rutstroemia sp. NJR-2017a WRK4]
MPHITTAMEWSRRRGIGEIMLDSFIRRRSVSGEISSVKDSFSSWSNCMAATYCKWPVIAVIVVGSLMIISVVWCIKLHDEPYFAPNQGYRAPDPMMGGGLGARPQPPQYASFEVGKNGFAVDPKSTLSDDALPPMPSWETAKKVHVLEEEKNAVELGELDPATGHKMPLMTGGASSHPPSPAVEQGSNNPYGSRPGPGGYMGAGGQSQNNLGGYGGSPNPGMANDPLMGYRGTPPPPGAAPFGYRGSPSPGPAGEQGMGYRGPPAGRGYGSPSPGPNRGPYQSTPSPGPGRGGYAGQEDTFTPMPQQFLSNDGFHDTPTTGYGQADPMYDNRPYPSQPSRSYSANSVNQGRQYSNQPYQPHESDNNYPPARGPSRGPGGPGRMISPAPANDGGFNAYSGRSPPPQDGAYGQYNTPMPMTRSPPPQEPAYPGYKPYTPATR